MRVPQFVVLATNLRGIHYYLTNCNSSFFSETCENCFHINISNCMGLNIPKPDFCYIIIKLQCFLVVYSIVSNLM